MMSSVEKDKDYEEAILIRNFTLPLHSTSLGSGSHSPFSIHVVVFCPTSSIPGGQVNVTVFPLSNGST